MKIDGVWLNHEVLGSGPPVVLIHGASGNLNDMTFRLAPLLARDHTVVAFDRPGHGYSDWPETGGDRLSDQAAVMRKALASIGIEKANVVGHGYGGSVALAWALDAPETVTGLILLGTPSQVWFGKLGAMVDLLASPITGPMLAHTAPFFITRGFVASAAAAMFAPKPLPVDYIDHLRLDLLLRPRSLRANAMQLSALRDQVRAMVPHYGSLMMPVEILHGMADRAVPIHAHSIPLASQIRYARLTRLERIGHMIHQVEPGLIQEALRGLPTPPTGRMNRVSAQQGSSR